MRNAVSKFRTPNSEFRIENTAIQFSNIKSKRSGYSRASNIPGVTAPKNL